MTEKTHYCGTGLPTSLYNELVEHAKLYGRSISKEIMVLVRDGLAARNQTTHEFAKPRGRK